MTCPITAGAGVALGLGDGDGAATEIASVPDRTAMTSNIAGYDNTFPADQIVYSVVFIGPNPKTRLPR